MTLSSLSNRRGCEDLAQAVTTLERALYADAAPRERGLSQAERAAFRHGLEVARDSIVSVSGAREVAGSLPSLNPAPCSVE